MVRMNQTGAAALRPAWQLDVAEADAPGPTGRDVTTLTAGAAGTASPEDLAGADERRLVQASVEGNQDAFALIVERHRRTVYQVCFRFVGNHEDASDLTQDVFIRAYRGLARFKAESTLSTWLYRIAVNASLNRVSLKTAATEPLEVDRHVDERASDPADEVLRHERASRVRAAIARLPKKQRATLVLRVYQELPHEQIAKILGSSVGAVKANFCHALGNLKRILTAQSEDEGPGAGAARP
jgi:RNA polymerase sigma-70 factor (ECF subfamily)